MPDWNQSVRHQIDLVCDQCEKQLQAGATIDLTAIIQEAQEAGISGEHLDDLRREIEGLVASYSIEQVTLDAPSGQATQVENSQSRGSDFATVDSEAMTKNDRPVQPGQSIRYVGDYEILDEVARGGMGVVYRAKQKTLGRVVALKMILSGQLASDQEVKRFYAEAEAAAGLDHPGIVPIYEVGRHDDHHYFSMALIEGPSLSEEMRDGPLPIRRTVNIVRQIAEAVQYAHDREVIHRDLKPGNVLLDDTDQPHITDFGLAKRGTGADLTASGQVLGTPAYMPPEQARGQTGEIGPHSDVYSIGAILYAMLLGRPPHAAESAVETLKQVIDVEPPSVRSLNPSIPKDLETICQKCLIKSPAQRYPTAQEIADELGRFERGEPIHARPVSRLEKTMLWAKRKPAAAALVACLLALMGLLAIGGPLTAFTQARLRQNAETNAQRAKVSAQQEREARAEADQSRQRLADENRRNRHALYARTISLAYGQFKQGNLTSSEDSLQSTDAELRGMEWDYLNGLCNSEQQRFLGLTDLGNLVAMTADGNHVVAAQARGARGLLVWHVDNAQPIAKVDGNVLAINSDASRAALIDPKVPLSVRVVEPTTGRLVNAIQTKQGRAIIGTFGGPEDRLLGLVTDDRHIRVMDVSSGQEVCAIEEKWRQQLHPIAISPRGDRIAWRRRDDNGVQIHDLPSGQRLYDGPVDPSMRNFSCPIVYSPDGAKIAVGGYEVVELRDAVSGMVTMRLTGIKGHVKSISFSPDSKRLAVTCGDGSIRVFETERGRTIAFLTGHQIGLIYGIPAVAFDATGQYLLSVGADNYVKLWDAYQGDEQAVNMTGISKGYDRPDASQEVDYLTQPEHMVESIRFVDNDTKLVCAGRDRAVRLFDVESRQQLQVWEELGDNQACVDYWPAANTVICGGGSLGDTQPGLVLCLDVSSGEERWSCDAAIGPINRLQYFDEGQRIAVSVGSQSAPRGQVLVLDAENGEVVWQFSEFPAALRAMDVSPDGNMIACVGNADGIWLLQSQTGELIKQFGDRAYFAIDFNKESDRIAVGGQDWSVRLFDVKSERQVWSSRRHAGAVLGLQFTSDDERLVSVALDGTTRIWDTSYGDELVALSDDGAEKLTMSVTRDGSHVAVAGVNDTVLIRQFKRSDSNVLENDWVEIFADDFESGELGEHWKQVGGRWQVQEGRAVGALQVNPLVKVINSAGLQYSQPVLDDAEIEFDVRAKDDLIVESKIMDASGTNAVHSFAVGITGTPFNHGERGGAVLSTASGAIRELGSRREGEFQLQPGQDYRIRTRRLSDRIEMYVDGKLFRSARVRLDVPLTAVAVQGLFGALDAQFSIDNVVIRVPNNSAAGRQAVRIVSELFDDSEIKPLVIEKIEAFDDEQLTREHPELKAGDVRRQAILLAERWDQSNDWILERIRELATENELSTETVGRLREWLRDHLTELNEGSHRTLSMLAYRDGDLGTAWDQWKEANRVHTQRLGYKHPIDAALEALFLKANPDNQKVAENARRRVEQLVRNQTMLEQPLVESWLAEVREEIPMESFSEFETLMGRAFSATYAMWIQQNVDPMAVLLADDAKVVSRRSVAGQNYERAVDRDDYLESQRLFAHGSRYGFDLVCQAAWTTRPDDQTVRLFADYVLQMPNGFHAYRQIDTFRKEDEAPAEQWKVKTHVTEAQRFRIGQQTMPGGADGWANWDGQVDPMPDSAQKADLLMVGARVTGALQLANDLCQSEPTRGELLCLVNAAWAANDPVTIREAIKQLVKLPYQSNGPPVVNYFMAKANLGDSLALPRNVTLRVPSFYNRGSATVLGAGDAGLAVYRADPQSLLAVIHGEKTDDLTNSVDEAIETRRNAFGAELIARKRQVIDGFPAETFTMRGLGMGYMIGGGAFSTIQRFAIIDRGEDSVTVLTSCLENQFSARDSEFDVILSELRLRKTENPDE